MLKLIRRTLAVLCFVSITLLFLDFTGTLHHWLGWMAKIQLLPAVLALNFIVIAALVVITLIFGRIYCSVICPLGVMQDLISWIHSRRKKNRFSYSKEIKWLRYPLLLLLIVAIVLGIGSLVSLLDPYSTYGQIATNLFQPVYLWCNNGLAAIAEHYNSYTFYSVDVWIKSITALVLSASLLIIIAILVWYGGRTYCNTLCPVGTLLSLLSRFSLLKIHIDDDKCIKCGLCTRNCKSSCIDYKNGTVDHSRCVTCGNCIEKCNKDAIYYGRPRKAAVTPIEPQNQEGIDKGKRAFLISSGIALATTAMAKAK
jgi:polyferredoxin